MGTRCGRVGPPLPAPLLLVFFLEKLSAATSFLLTGLLLLHIAAPGSSALSGPAVGSIAPNFHVRNLLTGEKIPLSKQLLTYATPGRQALYIFTLYWVTHEQFD